MASASMTPEAGHPKLVLWDNPEGKGGEGGGGRGFRIGETHKPVADMAKTITVL